MTCTSNKMILIIVCFASAYASALENMEVTRYVDISTQLVFVNTKIEIMNNNANRVDHYVYIVDPQWVENLSFIEVLDSHQNRLIFERFISEFDDDEKPLLQYKIVLPKPLSSGETIHILVSLSITNYLKSYPKSVKQYEQHKVLFSFNVYYHSLYFSHAQTTYLHIGTAKATLIDGAMYTIANNSEFGLQYGPYYEAEPFKYNQSILHYENNSPFLIIEKLNRNIKLSHWGYISVWDQVQLVHSGPKLKGPFKRYLHQNKNSVPKDTRIEEFVSTLPSRAFDIYLRDEIGLIWSFQTNNNNPYGVGVLVMPRNILYGGWKNQYEIGYTLPISDFITYHGNEYVLSFPLMDKIFPNMIVKEADINVILPEGAELGAVGHDFMTENKTDGDCYQYYFDTTCRKVVSFKRHNLVEKHIVNLSIEYSFSQLNLLTKPLIIAMYLYFVFILVKIFSMPHSSAENEKPIKSFETNNYPVYTATKKKNKPKRNAKQK